jgi:hypothetical protein
MSTNGCVSSGACEPIRNNSLVERVNYTQDILKTVLDKAESIHGELFGHSPCDSNRENEKSICSLEEVLAKTHNLVTQLDDRLSETLVRLKG